MYPLKIHKNDCQVTIGKSGGKLYKLSSSLKIKPKQHSVMYFELPINREVTMHYHPHDEESYYIISGTAEVNVNGKSYSLSPGDFLYLPPNSKHQLKNVGNECLLMLAFFSSPDALEKSIDVESK